MKNNPLLERYTVGGFYGDKTVKLIRFHPVNPNGRVVLILHGVFGNSDESAENKYGDISRMLAERGIGSILAENSRMRRDRLMFGDDRTEWARCAFLGKTFAQELGDAVAAVRSACESVKSGLWLWGFSLGGICAVLIAGGMSSHISGTQFDMPRLEGLVVSGSGDKLYEDVEAGFASQPILSTMGSYEYLHQAAVCMNSDKFISFYGSRDDSFPPESCSSLVDMAKVKQKEFHVIEGADHSFRHMDGQASLEPLHIMVDKIASWM